MRSLLSMAYKQKSLVECLRVFKELSMPSDWLEVRRYADSSESTDCLIQIRFDCSENRLSVKSALNVIRLSMRLHVLSFQWSLFSTLMFRRIQNSFQLISDTFIE